MRGGNQAHADALEILPEYLQTIFIAKPPEAGWPERFVIITACNPRSGGDDTAHKALGKTPSRLGCWKHRVEGASGFIILR